MSKKEKFCPIKHKKKISARVFIEEALKDIREQPLNKMNLIWIEGTGCSGQIISLLNAQDPDMVFLLRELANITFNNSIMAKEGEKAYEAFLNTLDTDFVLFVDGAIATKSEGAYTIIANYKGTPITLTEAVKKASVKAKYIVAIGTCASYGGISAAAPNPAECVSLKEFLKKDVINVPGCPAHPDWIIGTLAHLVRFGSPQLDADGRPILFYGITIHDRCSRRSYFDNRIFAKKLGDPECMFKLGCRGPVTKTDCPIRKWNGYYNWPVEDNTPCIGCAAKGFPDKMEPFINY